MTAREAHHHEKEVSFFLSAADAGPTWEVLRNEPAEWRGAHLRRKIQTRTVIHFYLRQGRDGERRRVRVREQAGERVISLESKRVIREDELVMEKLETLERDKLSSPQALTLLSGHDAVVSAFIKNQYRVRCLSPGTSFKVSLDQLLPFRPDEVGRTGHEFWHCEFEEIRDWDPGLLPASAWFQQNLAFRLSPLDEPKWLLAMMGEPAALAARSPRALDACLDSLLDRGRARMLPAASVPAASGPPARLAAGG